MAFIPEIDDQLEPILMLVNSNREAGLSELKELAETGQKSAILYLGLYLSEEERTTEAAIKWLLLANEFESPDAAWNLAMIARQRGQMDEMKQWIDRSAELGEEDAKEVQDNGYDVAAVLATWRD
jgi:TPR repeat protein